MKRSIITLSIIISTITYCFAQDIITKKTGEDMQVKILEVTTTDIKYKKDTTDGPIFTLPKSEILMVKYEDGTKEIFKDQQVDLTTNFYAEGKKDAAEYYTAYKPAGTITLISSLIMPLLGLAPAVVFSCIPPAKNNLDYPNEDLFKQPKYKAGYTKKATGIKIGKVWTNWGIGLGVNVLLLLLLTKR